jgi:hypothetical protein
MARAPPSEGARLSLGQAALESEAAEALERGYCERGAASRGYRIRIAGGRHAACEPVMNLCFGFPVSTPQ